jgi:hypothetical protein
MLKNLTSVSSKFYEDQALILMAFGGFGRYVLSLLHQEFERLGVPGSKVRFLVFDTEKPHRDRLDLEREAEYFIHLDEFDGDVYLENKENEELKDAVGHVPFTLFRDIEGGCKGVPAVGFVSFHKYDDHLVTKQALNVVDSMRAKNPGKKVKLILISGMGGSVSNGMSVPFLYRVRNRLREKKIRVEVYLATAEGHLGLQNIQEETLERNCAASAMLWEYAIAGRNGLIYPGKNGFRDRKMFDGKIAHRFYVFSGGSAETSLKYQAIASTIAQSISTLEMTKVGSYLDGDRVNYSAHVLEREWEGQGGYGHPTALMTMNVAGLKADCLPQIFHLHAVKRFIEDLNHEITFEEGEKTKGKAISCFLENNLNEDDILKQFEVDVPTITPETINREKVSQENAYEFLKAKIADLQAGAEEEFERKKQVKEVSSFINRVKESFSQYAEEIVMTPGEYLKGGLIFYEKLQSALDEKIKHVADSVSRVEKELFEGTNQKTLTTLLDKLEGVTERRSGLGEIVVKFGHSSSAVSLVKQIIETVSRMQQQKKEKYNHLLLQYIYNDLAKFLQDEVEILKNSLFQYNKMVSEVDREIEKIKRIGRSAFTYNESRFDELTEEVLEKLYGSLELISTQDVVGKLGSPVIRKESGAGRKGLEELLGIIKPDFEQLTGVVEDLFCNEEKVYEYIRAMLDQFFLTLKLDRDRFPTLETSQSSFVLCTKRFYDRYRDDLFEGFAHIETENPYNVIVTRHEEGFPFIAVSYFHRINGQFKEHRTHGKSGLGHILKDLDTKLPLLDA